MTEQTAEEVKQNNIARMGEQLGAQFTALWNQLSILYLYWEEYNELFGTKPEGKDSATIAGLVSELAGRIPRKGEFVEEDGLRFEVLESTDRKVERVRVTPAQPRQLKLI